ncbi:hypothetical protein DWV72_08825 [Firmicutes bacterium AF12-30]|nr:hypothetical protein DWV72_08825 [Firmicutes bacterium AF12-30]
MSKKKKKQFITTFIIIIIAAMSEWLALWLNGMDSSIRWLHIIARIMDHSLAPVVAMIFCITIDAERQAKILTLPIIVHTVLEILSGYFGFIYFVDANNIYHHGSMYWIYVYYLEVVEKTDGLIGLLDRHSYKEAFRHQNEEAAVVMQDLTRRKLS